MLDRGGCFNARQKHLTSRKKNIEKLQTTSSGKRERVVELQDTIEKSIENLRDTER